MSKISQLLGLENDSPQLAEQLLPLVYDELRRIAAALVVRESPGQTLQPTVLVHEAYVRLFGDAAPTFAGRGHFFTAAAEAMRRLLVEQARRRHTLKRGGDRRQVGLEAVEPAIESPYVVDLLALDEALTRFKGFQPDKAKLVELRYFVGVSLTDAAEILGISRQKADRWWVFARAWLRDQLDDGTIPANS